MDEFKVVAFFLVPLVVAGAVGSFLHKLTERLEEKNAPKAKLSSAERAEATADSVAKAQRSKARKEEAEELPPLPPAVALDETLAYELPADFNLAEFSDRSEARAA